MYLFQESILAGNAGLLTIRLKESNNSGWLEGNAALLAITSAVKHRVFPLVKG